MSLKVLAKHLQGKHPQSTHAPKSGKTAPKSGGGSGGEFYTTADLPQPGQYKKHWRKRRDATLTAEELKLKYPDRYRSVGPRGVPGGATEIRIPAGVSLSDDFKRGGLKEYGGPGTKAEISGWLHERDRKVHLRTPQGLVASGPEDALTLMARDLGYDVTRNSIQPLKKTNLIPGKPR